MYSHQETFPLIPLKVWIEINLKLDSRILKKSTIFTILKSQISQQNLLKMNRKGTKNKRKRASDSAKLEE